MAHRFCDDHEWVGGGNEYCPQCDEAFRCIVPEAATPPTNPEIAQLQARVAELEVALRGVTGVLDQMGDQPDRLVCPEVWRRLNCEELVTLGKEALGVE